MFVGVMNFFFCFKLIILLSIVDVVNAEVVLKATNVDGVYDNDPRCDPNARLLENLTYQEVMAKDLSVMDMTAITLCQTNKIPGIFRQVPKT